jgi:hypothetical protein
VLPCSSIPSVPAQNTQPVSQGLSKNQIKNLKKAKAAAEDLLKQKGKEITQGKDCYSDVICYNYGDPGHHKSSCPKSAVCFVCNSIVHKEDTCPVKKLPPPAARLVGSGIKDLEFLHVEIPEGNGLQFGISNIGIVFIEAGEVSKEELAKEFSVIYKTNWPWQIRTLDSWSFLVKFPPHLRVEDVASYPCFGLVKEGVTVNVKV